MENDIYLKENDFLQQYEDLLFEEEIYWKQKSRETQISEGDRNTKLFHNSTKYRGSVDRFLTIKNERGEIIENSQDLAKEFVNFCQATLNNKEFTYLSAQQHV